MWSKFLMRSSVTVPFCWCFETFISSCMLWKCIPYSLVRLWQKNHLVSVRKRACFGKPGLLTTNTPCGSHVNIIWHILEMLICTHDAHTFECIHHFYNYPSCDKMLLWHLAWSHVTADLIDQHHKNTQHLSDSSTNLAVSGPSVP